MTDFITHLRLEKYDPFQGIFTAIAAKGSTVDRSKERFDFQGSKPYFQEWSDEQYAASDGKSYGNVRLQHDDKKPVGLLTSPIEFDDTNELIRVTGKVADPIAKELLQQGVLTGVSIGGKYIKKTLNTKDGVTDYIAKPSEISVVDRPCLKEATFELVKEDGTTELRKFADEKTADELIAKHFPQPDLAKKLDAVLDAFNAFMEIRKADACKCGMCESCTKRNFSDKQRSALADEGKALPDGSFPIENKKDLENAIQAIGRAKDPAKAKAHIIARAKALGAEDLIPDSWEAESSDTNKVGEGQITMTKTFTADELTKAHKTVVDRIADCHKAASDQCAARKAAADEHMSDIHGHLNAMHKAITGEDTVPMEATKADPAKEVKKADNKKDDKTMTDEDRIAKTAEAVLKALGIEPPKQETEDEKIAKRVLAVLEPMLKQAHPQQNRPRFSFDQSVEKKELSQDEVDKLAKSVAKSPTLRNPDVLALFKATAAEQLEQMGLSN